MSIERQREIIQQWADARGHTVVGWAEDVGVSGAVDPFVTAELGRWLNRRGSEWDVLCAWRLDRLGRNMIQLHKLFGWCAEQGKALVACTENIDLSGWTGRMLAAVIAGLAEGELEAIRERQRSSRSKLRQAARWPGGKPPFGYLAVPRVGGGWTLAVDPEASRLVRRIVDDVLDAKPLTRIACELNAEGYRTPRAYYVTQQAAMPALRWAASETPAGKWSTTSLRNMLRSNALRGYVHHNGEAVRDNDGIPVQLAEPLVTLDEWELIRTALDRVGKSRRGIRRPQPSPLAGIAVCANCGLTLHHDRNVAKRNNREYVYRYYRCQNQDTVLIRAEALETLAEEAFLAEVGALEVRERVWTPGDTREAELREAMTALDELITAAGRAVSSTAKQRLHQQLDTLDARIAELEAAPAHAARWEYRPTGQTYRSVWEFSDPVARRELLRKSGITIAAGVSRVGDRRSASNPGAIHAEIRIPAELKATLGLSG